MSDLRSFLARQAEKPLCLTMSNRVSSLNSRGRKRRETKARREEILAEWKEALESLVGQLECWLREADEDHALTIDRIPIVIGERRFGAYEVEGLRVRLGIMEFRVEPIARDSVGTIVGDELGTTLCDGNVKISGGYRKYSLYRRKAEQGDEWVMADDQTYEPRILDQSTFEDAVYQLLN